MSDWAWIDRNSGRPIARSVQALENKDVTQSVPLKHVQVRKHLCLWGRSRRPENNVCWLAPSNIFQLRGGGGGGGGCAYWQEYGNWTAVPLP